MITSVNFSPKYYSPGYNPIIWSVTSDKATANNVYDFKYVFDVYIDGAYINRFKQRPNPAGVGMLDVSTMIDPYLEIGDFANEVGVPTSTPFKTGFNATCSVYVLAGEEYRSPTATSTIQIYNGLNATPGLEPAYLLGAQGYTGGTGGTGASAVIALPASLDWQEQQAHLQVQQTGSTDYYGLFGYMAPYIMKNNTIVGPSTCGGPGLFLSNMPRTNVGGNWQGTSAAPPHNYTCNDLSYDRRTVSFLNRNPVYENYVGGTKLQSAAPKVAWFEFYNATGANIGEYGIGNYEQFGGAPRENCGDSIAATGANAFSNSISQELLSLRVGPKDLEDLGIWTSLGQVPAYYTVQLYDNLNISAGCTYASEPTVPLSELVTINVVEDCFSTLYPRGRLVWLNDKGGREYWDFTMFAEESVNSTQQDWYQSEVNWSSTTPVELSGDTTQNWLRGGVRQYNKSVNTKWTITSDFLTQDDVELLKGIVESPQTWIYIGTDDFPYTCKVTENSYTVKTIKMVKLFTATFNVDISTIKSMQTI